MLFHSLEILLIALLALLIDRWFGEFSFIRHPVVVIGDAIKIFEHKRYQNNVGRGVQLTIFVVFITAVIGIAIESVLGLLPGLVNLFLTAIAASTLLAHRMLHDTVRHLIQTERPQTPLKMLVSRDTDSLNDSDCYKAGIESYAENLSDGVIAPLFYLLLFGLPGILVYKAINTLDSMVGYRTARYEKFGKCSAKLDDWVNWIPARMTAVLIMLVNGKARFWRFYQQGRLHDSPNAGHPITAMALNIGCQLGGDTVYFGELKPKAVFGEPHATKTVEAHHVKACLAHRPKVDGLL